jgi:hypothetical protein
MEQKTVRRKKHRLSEKQRRRKGTRKNDVPDELKKERCAGLRAVKDGSHDGKREVMNWMNRKSLPWYGDAREAKSSMY